MMWLGILDGADQLPAMKHFRTRFNETLGVFNCELQEQGYENVLKEDQRIEEAFTEVCEYIARNPERAALVPPDGYSGYKCSGCIVPGHPASPELSKTTSRTVRLCRKSCPAGRSYRNPGTWL